MNKIIITLIFLISPQLVLSNPYMDIDNSTFEKFDISGYLGYRYIWSSIGTDPVGSYPEAGLLLNYNPTQHISANMQLNVNRNALEYNMENILTYGFLSYQNSFGSIPFRVNIGKLRHEFGLYNANIVNPSTRPSGTVAPQSIYWNNLSSTLTSGYGVHAEVYLGDFKLGYTIDKHIIVDEEQESLMWAGVPFVDMDPYFGSHQIVNFNYEPNDLPIVVKTSWTRLKLNKDIKDIQFATLGVEYDNNTFSASAEILLLRPTHIDWTDIDELRYGYSISTGYYIWDDFEVHVNANIYENSGINQFGLYEDGADKWKDFSIGATKYVEDFEVKADIHKVYGGRVLKPHAFDNDGIDDWWYVGTSIVYHF